MVTTFNSRWSVFIFEIDPYSFRVISPILAIESEYGLTLGHFPTLVLPFPATYREYRIIGEDMDVVTPTTFILINPAKLASKQANQLDLGLALYLVVSHPSVCNTL